MSSQFTTVSSSEARKKSYQPEGQPFTYAPLTKRAIVYGLIAGLLMSLFLSVSGFFITGDNAGFGFLKYIILGAALVPLLSQVRKVSPPGIFFKNGLVTGLFASVTAAVVSVIATLLFNTKEALEGPVSGAGEVMLNRGTLAGFTFFETFVAGIILTFICLQFLKSGGTTK